LLGPERVYRWTPTSSGPAAIFTCGTGTQYDTVVYLRSSSCTGQELTCNDDAPCAISGSSSLGSRITPTVTAGQTYYIVVDGYGGTGGPYALTVQAPAACGNGVREGAEQCDGGDSSQCVTGQCRSNCTCVPPTSGQPDLTPEIVNWNIQLGATVSAGDVAEGCAETTVADLLRFGVRVKNTGTADLVLGNPLCPDCTSNPLAVCGNPNFTCSPAEGHNHPHYSNYARYELLDPSSQAVVIGHKQGFCLLDSECPNPKFSCFNQGISAGCSDVYGSELGCQYLDITGIPPGDYTLRVTVDPFSRLAELNEGNNVITVPVAVPDPAANTCANPAVIPAAGGVFTGSTSGSSFLSGSCGDTVSAPEKVFQWTPSISGRATIQTCGTSTNFDTVLYMRSGSCQSGSQVACNDDASGCAIAGGSNYGSRITPNVTAGQTYYIVVDGYGTARGNFRLSVSPPTPSACLSPTVIPAAGGVFTGTTSGASTQSGTCATTNSAPEKVFQWTPSTSGTATVQTCGAGTSFNTVLYMRSGTCETGGQVACNNNTTACSTASGADHGSRITPTVTAGQTYYIILDGAGSASGNFSLSVTPPP
jgi:hypothetical protein